MAKTDESKGQTYANRNRSRDVLEQSTENCFTITRYNERNERHRNARLAAGKRKHSLKYAADDAVEQASLGNYVQPLLRAYQAYGSKKKLCTKNGKFSSDNCGTTILVTPCYDHEPICTLLARQSAFEQCWKIVTESCSKALKELNDGSYRYLVESLKKQDRAETVRSLRSLPVAVMSTASTEMHTQEDGHPLAKYVKDHYSTLLAELQCDNVTSASAAFRSVFRQMSSSGSDSFLSVSPTKETTGTLTIETEEDPTDDVSASKKVVETGESWFLPPRAARQIAKDAIKAQLVSGLSNEGRLDSTHSHHEHSAAAFDHPSNGKKSNNARHLDWLTRLEEWYACRPNHNHSCSNTHEERIVIYIEDTDELERNVLAQIIYQLAQACDRIPLCLILGVSSPASTAETFGHEITCDKAIVHYFPSATSSECIGRVIYDLLHRGLLPLQISPSVLNTVLAGCRHNNSLASFLSALRLMLLEHFRCVRGSYLAGIRLPKPSIPVLDFHNFVRELLAEKSARDIIQIFGKTDWQYYQSSGEVNAATTADIEESVCNQILGFSRYRRRHWLIMESLLCALRALYPERQLSNHWIAVFTNPGMALSCHKEYADISTRIENLPNMDHVSLQLDLADVLGKPELSDLGDVLATFKGLFELINKVIAADEVGEQNTLPSEQSNALVDLTPSIKAAASSAYKSSPGPTLSGRRGQKRHGSGLRGSGLTKGVNCNRAQSTGKLYCEALLHFLDTLRESLDLLSQQCLWSPYWCTEANADALSQLTDVSRLTMTKRLLYPQTMIRCDCCEYSSGPDVNTTEDVPVLYKLLTSTSDRLFSLHGLYQQFVENIESRQEDTLRSMQPRLPTCTIKSPTDDELRERCLVARFTRCICELQHMGFIRPYGKQGDLMQRLVFGN